MNPRLVGSSDLEDDDSAVSFGWVEKNVAEFPVGGYKNSGLLLGKLQNDFIW